MGSYFDKSEPIWDKVLSLNNIPRNLLEPLYFDHYWLAFQLDMQNSFSKPLPWIGIYIVLASVLCILAMAADLVHGLRNKKLWFPCKYFTLNAASFTVIGVAMKLPMDLNNPMPGFEDQAAKVGSMAFMCTIMANTLPSQASIDGKELLSNIIALGILVITLVVNVCIQIDTQVISSTYSDGPFNGHNINDKVSPKLFIPMALIYVGMLLILLVIYASSSIAIVASKHILELKYQKLHEATLKDQQQGRLSVEKLKQHVIKCWIMVETGNPQFMTASSVITSASGVICAISTILHIVIMYFTIPIGTLDHESDYKWTTVVILIVQFIGVILGTIAPVSRCFTSLSFKLSTEWIWNHMMNVFKVESRWTHKLLEWRQTSIPYTFRSHKCRIVIENLKILILSICIGFQKTVVVACKMISMIPILFVILVLYCSQCWKWLKAMLSTLGILLGKTQEEEELEQNMDLHRYALQLREEMEFSHRTLIGISKSMNQLIQKAAKRQPNNLMRLLEKSRRFEGVGKYDSHQVPPLLSEEHCDCWSLPLITLTTIAISLPNIQKNIVDRLMSSVCEGLVYATLVDESFYVDDNYVKIIKATKALWLYVEVHHEWCGNSLREFAPQLSTAGHIVRWFKDIAINMIVAEVESEDMGIQSDNKMYRSIVANSMYRITETILLSYDKSIDEVSQEELFEKLSLMIADILAACLSNLPPVIMMKCHTSEVENWEASVHVAAQLLGETMQIINSLEDRELPNLNPDELPFIDKWRAYLQHSYP